MITEDERNILRTMIEKLVVGCENFQPALTANFQLKITKKGLSDLSTKSDEEIRAMILLWQANETSRLTKQKEDLIKKSSDIDTQLAILTAIPVGVKTDV